MSDVLDVAKKDGRWTECPACCEIVITHKLAEQLWVCPHCDFHFRLNPRQRIEMLCDPEGFVPIVLDQISGEEAITCGQGTIGGHPCLLGLMDFAFQGGSMGVDLGQHVVALMQHAAERSLPLIFFCASGGVRVQEGIWGLLQMLRTVHARNLTCEVPMVTVFTDPTLGGVTASFSGLADILIAEPGCRIGFAGQRVIESVINFTPPDDFQDASRLLENGFLDRIVHRHDLKDTLAFLLV